MGNKENICIVGGWLPLLRGSTGLARRLGSLHQQALLARVLAAERGIPPYHCRVPDWFEFGSLLAGPDIVVRVSPFPPH